MLTLAEARSALARAECLYDAAAVDRAVAAWAARIRADYAERNPLVLCVLKGGVFASARLLAHLDFPLEFDCLQVGRYRNRTRGGDLDWRIHPETPLAGRDLLIVDDILDEGVTLAAVAAACREEGAASVALAVLARKARPVPPATEADYVALTVPDRYVFGCGMDYRGYFRNLNAIWAIDE
ncbi:MAG: hypoxanthine-guanine phosphoribosyltransferase [Gammaproteobacteria bacterium]|nr:MAG: hypoxanthine-guanine phosphoribosyltransferase [Gammaproteobacteria bacterium]